MTSLKLSCRACGITRTRIRYKRRTSGTGFYFVDEKGRYWDGRMCPKCKNAKIAARTRLARRQIQVPVEESYVMRAPYTRSCRVCGTKTHNYFYCPACLAGKAEGFWDMGDKYGVVL